MKTSVLIFAIATMTAFTAHSQDQIPNRNFDNWTDKLIGAEPEQWQTGDQNMQSFLFNGYYAIDRTETSTTGGHALKLTNFTGITGLQSPKVNLGTLQNQTIRNGTSLTEKPSGFAIDYKTPLNEEKVAEIVFHFAFNLPDQEDTVITEQFNLPGNVESFSNFSRNFENIPESYPSPEEMAIEISLSNQTSGETEGYVIFDNLALTGTNDKIPNGEFSSWFIETIHEPEGWASTNSLAAIIGTPMMAEPTNDAYQGDYALQITPVNMGGGSWQGMAFVSDEILTMNENLDKSGFPVSVKPEGITGYYKFPNGPDSSASFHITLNNNDEVVWDTTKYLNSADEFTKFNIDFENIPSADQFNKADVGVIVESESSVPNPLIIDNLFWESPVSSVGKKSKTDVSEIHTYPNPAGKNWYIEVPGNENFSVNLRNMKGQLKYQKQFSNTGSKAKVNTNHLEPGIYSYLIEASGRKETGRLVIR